MTIGTSIPRKEDPRLLRGLGRFGGDFAIGRTIPYCLKNARCTVWVVREPIPEETA